MREEVAKLRWATSTNDRKRNGKSRVSEKEEIEEKEEENEERNSTALHQGHSHLPRLACYFYHGGIAASLGGVENHWESSQWVLYIA